MSPGVPAPTLENQQINLDEALEHIHLKHWQAEQVEQIMAEEAVQLQEARMNPNLSVARLFQRQYAIRIQTRRRIASILTPKQSQRITELMIQRMVRRENRLNDF